MLFAESDWTFAEILTLSASVLGYLLTLVLIRWVLLIKKRNPVSTVAWILAIVLIPLFGGVLFILFGINRVKRRREQRDASLRSLVPHGPSLAQYHVIPDDDVPPMQQRMMVLARRLTGSSATSSNRIELLADTNRTLGLIEQAIHSAKSSLHLEFYIWQPDGTGSRVRDLLIEKAKQGVAVRFLYDKIGSMRLGKRFLRPMLEAGIQVAPFLPGMTLRERFSINLRSHRKIVIVDGSVGFTGGMNIGDEYLGRNRRIGYWRDTHLRFTGPTVLQLQQVFAEDWYFATGEDLNDPALFPPPTTTGHTVAHVIAGEPAGNVDAFYSLMFAAINEARDRITLATSYFVPPQALATALETAALRGVQVRLLLAGRSEYLWTLLAGRSYYDTLLEAGVEIYEYERGLLHSKTLTIDGRWSLVGTPNFDARSLLLNFEVALAMYDGGIALELEEHFEEDRQWAKRVDPAEFARRSTWRVLTENTCRLFAPIL
ncbi:MAG: cardiolipin synthase [Planctomycetaceae bacterium]